MAFILNKGYDNEQEINAQIFHEKDSLVVFSNPQGMGTADQIYAVPVSSVITIEKKTS